MLNERFEILKYFRICLSILALKLNNFIFLFQTQHFISDIHLQVKIFYLGKKNIKKLETGLEGEDYS
jgi:hypothetical protein